VIDDIDSLCNNIRGEYHTFAQIETKYLQNIATDHPNIASLFSIGESF